MANIERVAEEIKRDMTDIIRSEINDPRIDSLISVTEVSVSGDLGYAKVYISKLGKDEERQEVVDVLNKASGYIRTLLSKRLKTRTVPALEFLLDDSMIYGAKIDGILNDLKNDQ
ncbi:30S ribosome-binding factor RbfA [Peptococcus simiae]|uniref:Ribosome-binding factor A n=1 Tax=Peptococcus simiae TaxID=1643805 RepID=A0ABW9GYD8_9FIRM